MLSAARDLQGRAKNTSGPPGPLQGELTRVSVFRMCALINVRTTGGTYNTGFALGDTKQDLQPPGRSRTLYLTKVLFDELLSYGMRGKATRWCVRFDV